MGRPRFSRPGTGCARGSEGLGSPVGQTPAPGRALTTDTLAVIRLTAPKLRARGRGFETAEQAAERARFDLALVAVLSDGGVEAQRGAALTWGDVQSWNDGSGRITVICSKTDALAQGAVVAITPAAMQALDAIRPVGVTSGEKVFGLSESQIARRVKVIARAAGLVDWEFFSGHSGLGAWPGAWPRMARPPMRSNARAAGSRAAAWSAATPAASRPGRRCDTCSCSQSQRNSYSEACGLRAFPCACGACALFIPKPHPMRLFQHRQLA